MAVATKRAPQKYAPFARLLSSEHEELLDRLGDHREAVLVERVPDDTVGLASRTLLEDLAIGTLQRDQQLLREVEAALGRLYAGDYGVCERCREDIPGRRLKALPWTRLCLRCAERRQALSLN
ncbi:TraR/DksA family transcriptional regulator [Acidobacteriia bacterium AH_259_A11_L15]|nr:TraR/DksA family transcriptional regulator [Acidobacteriia bacterium AH_259_A11_L15]